MKKIRIGKDIEFSWKVLTNGEETSLAGRDLRLLLQPPVGNPIELSYTVSGCTMSFLFPGTSQKCIGSYSITLWENYGKTGQTVVDSCKAFELVQHTHMECDVPDVPQPDLVYITRTVFNSKVAEINASIDKKEDDFINITNAGIATALTANSVTSIYTASELFAFHQAGKRVSAFGFLLAFKTFNFNHHNDNNSIEYYAGYYIITVDHTKKLTISDNKANKSDVYTKNDANSTFVKKSDFFSLDALELNGLYSQNYFINGGAKWHNTPAECVAFTYHDEDGIMYKVLDGTTAKYWVLHKQEGTTSYKCVAANAVLSDLTSLLNCSEVVKYFHDDLPTTVDEKADKSTTYTKSEVDAELAKKPSAENIDAYATLGNPLPKARYYYAHNGEPTYPLMLEKDNQRYVLFSARTGSSMEEFFVFKYAPSANPYPFVAKYNLSNVPDWVKEPFDKAGKTYVDSALSGKASASDLTYLANQMNLVLDMQHPLRISWDGEGVKMYYVTDTANIPSKITDVPNVTTYYESMHSPVVNPDIKWFSFYNNPYNTTLTKIKIEGGRSLVDLHRAFQMLTSVPDEEQASAMPDVEVDLTNLDVSNVTTLMTFAQLFPNAISFGDLSKWNTSKATSMSSMFSYCYRLSSVGDLSNWDVSKVTNMYVMFSHCYKLTSVGNLSNWDVSNVENMRQMFNSCYELTSVGNLSNWNTSKVTNMQTMFQLCKELTSVGDLSNWDTSKVTDISWMFYQCHKLQSVGNLSNWDVSNVENMQQMFQMCYELTSVGNLSNWDVSNVENMQQMFQMCYELTSVGNLSNWNTSKVTNIQQMFQLCKELTSVGDLSNWDTSNMTDINSIFDNCYKLTSVGNLSNWNTSKVTNMRSMFQMCYELALVGDLSNWDTSKVTDMKGLFQGCYKLTSVGNLSNWDVSQVTNMRYMFAYMENLGSLNLYGWDTTNADCTHIFTFQDGTDDGTHPHKKLTSLTLGPNFFNSTQTTSFDFNGCKAWTRASMMESLYTNQTGRDTTKVKEIVLHPDAYDRLTNEDRTNIASLGFTLTRFTI